MHFYGTQLVRRNSLIWRRFWKFIHHLGDTEKNFFMVEMPLEWFFRTLTFKDPLEAKDLQAIVILVQNERMWEVQVANYSVYSSLISFSKQSERIFPSMVEKMFLGKSSLNNRLVKVLLNLIFLNLIILPLILLTIYKHCVKISTQE